MRKNKKCSNFIFVTIRRKKDKRRIKEGYSIRCCNFVFATIRRKKDIGKVLFRVPSEIYLGENRKMKVKIEIKAILTEEKEIVFKSSSVANQIGQALLEANNQILQQCVAVLGKEPREN